jgi:hypothetical protein
MGRRPEILLRGFRAGSSERLIADGVLYVKTTETLGVNNFNDLQFMAKLVQGANLAG